MGKFRLTLNFVDVSLYKVAVTVSLLRPGYSGFIIRPLINISLVYTRQIPQRSRPSLSCVHAGKETAGSQPSLVLVLRWLARDMSVLQPRCASSRFRE